MISKKRLMVIFTIFLSIIMLSKVFGADTDSFKVKYGITTENVNLRYQSDTSKNNILKSVKKNTNVKIIGNKDNFYIVQIDNNNVGFMSKDYIKILDNDLKVGDAYESYSPKEYEATSNANIRSGPSTNFKKIGSLKKGTTAVVFGAIKDFYTVMFDKNKVGLVSKNLLEESFENIDDNPNNLSKQDLVVSYINEARKENGFKELKDTADLNRIATLKAEDMVKNNYFSHTSPTYGTPFNMLKNYGLTYNYAGENIAGNTSMKDAVEKWLSSENHKRNLLSNKYTKIGVGVQKSQKYGYIIVAIFTD